MENGLYTRRKFQIELYENEGADIFVVVNNDRYPDTRVVLTGENAERLILAIANCSDVIDETKGS